MECHVVVAGSRYFEDYATFQRELDALLLRAIGRVVIFHGGCSRGADRLAGQYAREKGLREVVCKADWRRYGYAAGPLRNKLMVKLAQPDLAICFISPDSRGTVDCIAQLSRYKQKANSRLRTILQVRVQC